MVAQNHRSDLFTEIIERTTNARSFEYQSGDSYESTTMSYSQWSEESTDGFDDDIARLTYCHCYGHDDQRPTLIIGSDTYTRPGELNIATIELDESGNIVNESDAWRAVPKSAREALKAISTFLSEHAPDPEPTPPTTPAPMPTRNRATSQKRDNQRAERALQREQYHNAAGEQSATMSAVIADAGFTAAEERDCSGTPVTIWHDATGLATIKQTPYSVRVYNGRPARMGKRADAGFTYRVAWGWQPSGTGTGEAAGVAALIEASIDIDDNGYGYLTSTPSEPLTPEEQAFADSLPPVELPPYPVLHNHHHIVRCQRCGRDVNTYSVLSGKNVCLECANAATPEPWPAKSLDPDSEYQQRVRAEREAVRASLTCSCGQPISRFAADKSRCAWCIEESDTVGQLLTVNAKGERKPVYHDASAIVADLAPQYPPISGGSHDHDACTCDPATEYKPGGMCAHCTDRQNRFIGNAAPLQEWAEANDIG